MSECCGKKRDARFCPECGRRLAKDAPGIDGLYDHCIAVHKSFGKQLENNQRRLELLDDVESPRLDRRKMELLKRQKQLRRDQAKWWSWVVAIEELTAVRRA